MEWEKPDFVETSLACEISGYANAELSISPMQAQAKNAAVGPFSVDQTIAHGD
jgi:hypothetical protein